VREKYTVQAHARTPPKGIVLTLALSDYNLWSPPDNLFYRDDTFIGKKTPSGKKVIANLEVARPLARLLSRPRRHRTLRRAVPAGGIRDAQAQFLEVDL